MLEMYNVWLVIRESIALYHEYSRVAANQIILFEMHIKSPGCFLLLFIFIFFSLFNIIIIVTLLFLYIQKIYTDVLFKFIGEAKMIFDRIYTQLNSCQFSVPFVKDHLLNTWKTDDNYQCVKKICIKFYCWFVLRFCLSLLCSY